MWRSGLVFFLLVQLMSGCGKTGAVPGPPVNAGSDSALVIDLKHTLPTLLKESSGLCYTDGQLWTFGDSGNPNAIYKIDSATGAILQTVTIANFPNVDWEDITADSSYIYVGDFGNNYGNRTDLRILRIKKSDIVSGEAFVTLQADAISFSYADQTDFSANENTNFDCEALAAIQGSLYIFTKDQADLQTRCYRLADTPGVYSLSPVAQFNSGGKITAAAYNPASGELALLGYMNKKIRSFIWLMHDYPGDRFFSGMVQRFNIGSQRDWQTEGLDYISGSRLMMSCETSTSHLASLYAVQKSW